ncbi:FKBP-type peptidyl-prolyl cis-trans isomerase [Collinsella tanakaei]|nr:FKBP-type peptidyl-prolyl cis-trans isomerase [Collinsella tanakaei]MBM6779181.1 FKBP-type peptidyl-prolyl cis-trans isomerase [Collinsella tanakaei]
MLELPVFSCTSTSFWRPCARHPSKAVFVSDFSLKHVVTVHYTGSFDDGEVFDTTRGRTPLTFVEGNHEVVPGFEAAVLSMEPGETKKVHLEPKDAYGERTAALVYSMPTIQIPNYDDLVVGEMIYLMNSDGYQQLARVAKVEDDGDTIFDFNHPMAGCALNFEIELLSREPYNPSAESEEGEAHA